MYRRSLEDAQKIVNRFTSGSGLQEAVLDKRHEIFISYVTQFSF